MTQKKKKSFYAFIINNKVGLNKNFSRQNKDTMNGYAFISKRGAHRR